MEPEDWWLPIYLERIFGTTDQASDLLLDKMAASTKNSKITEHDGHRSVEKADIHGEIPPHWDAEDAQRCQ